MTISWWRQMGQACGYLIILVLPGLLILGVWTGHEWLAVLALFVVSPLLRLVAGDAQKTAVIWQEALSRCLHALPAVYAVTLFSILMVCAWKLHQTPTLLWGEGLAFTASLWATLLTATVPAHELIHRPDALSQRLGRWVAGVAGYPMLGHEHRGHHETRTSRAQWPQITENVYAYARRQLRATLMNVIERDQFFRALKGHRFWRGELAEGLAATGLTTLLFTAALGWRGLLLYAITASLNVFCMQLMTYIQHWGLGEENQIPDNTIMQPMGWEDACQLQAWLSLNLSFHEAHHRFSQLPFYRLTLSKNAPRLPGGYVVMMVAALFPRLWRGLMMPALHHWQRFPAQPISAERSLVCINLASLERLQNLQAASLQNAESKPAPKQAWQQPPASPP